MKIALMLNPLGHSDHEADEGAIISLAPLSQRAVGRPRAQRPRKPSRERLRAQLKAFEFVVAHLEYVLRDLDDFTTDSDEEEAPTSIAEDDDAQRIRSHLKRTIVLSKQAKKEISKRTEYLHLLKWHYECGLNLRKLMRGVSLDDWFWMCERWRLLTRDYYEKLSDERCYEIAQETLLAIENHKPPQGAEETGALGWQDWAQLDDDGYYLRFMIGKTLPLPDLKAFVDHSWAIYQDSDLWKKFHLGDKCDFFIQAVQHISPDMMVIQSVEKYPDLVQLTHSLSLAFRVQTDAGYMIAIRSIDSPQLLDLMKAEGLSLSGNFFWDTFDVAHRDDQGECDAIRYTLAGSYGSDNPTYAKRARDEILIALVRNEMKLLDKPMLSTESPAEEDSDVTSANQAAQ